MPDTVQENKEIDALSSELGSIKLVKYFSFSSFAVILVFTFLLSWIISNNARTIMLEQNEEYSQLLAENINQQVFSRFVLPALIRYGDISLRKSEQFEMLDAIVRSIIQGLKIEAVTIYDSSRNIISYSTTKDLIGKENLGREEYNNALAGEPGSRLKYSGSVLSLLHFGKKVECGLHTFIPFRQITNNGVPNDNIMGVIEIQKDLVSNYKHILRFQGRIMIVSSLLMGILFMILRSIVSKAGERIERRAIERLRLREKLDQAERLAHLGTMIATVSHEIKSPLGIVHSTAEILIKRIRKVAPGNERLAQIIVEETERLNTIVIEFLDFARPQNIQPKPKQLSDVCAKVLNFLQPELQKNNISLITSFAKSVPACNIDTDKMYRALLNILVNSIQAMPDGGDLLVSVQHRQDENQKSRVQLLISDSGIGMSQEVQRQMFQPFFTQKRKSGTGLGLAIAKGIIERHDGKIVVNSEEGKGATFLIFFPPCSI